MRRLFWAGHAWRKEIALINKVLCGSSEGIRPLIGVDQG